MELNIRNANLNDIPFLVETIIEAEKSGTSIFSYSTIFGLSEDEAKQYISLMLEEEVDDCELSVSAFLLAESEGKSVGAVCAWIEGNDDIPSSTLKGNLLRYTLPSKCFESLSKLNNLIKELHIDYIDKAIQIGLVYISKEARGRGLVQQLLTEKTDELANLNPHKKDVYVQVFGNNMPAIKAYEKVGFEIISTKVAISPDIINYLPANSKVLMKLIK